MLGAHACWEPCRVFRSNLQHPRSAWGLRIHASPVISSSAQFEYFGSMVAAQPVQEAEMLYQPVENSPDDAVPMEGVFAFLECNSQRCQLHAIHPAAVCYRRSGGGSRVAVWISRSGQRDGRGVRGTVCWLLLQQMVAHALPGGGPTAHLRLCALSGCAVGGARLFQACGEALLPQV